MEPMGKAYRLTGIWVSKCRNFEPEVYGLYGDLALQGTASG